MAQGNKYPGECAVCGEIVPARKGVVLAKMAPDGRRTGYEVFHLRCDRTEWSDEEIAEADARNAKREAGITVIHFPNTGNTVFQNRNGRCEDAPCCGCCTC